MAEFTLDTSGEVRGERLIEQPDGNWRSHWTWSDLDAFPQGYVEAALKGAELIVVDRWGAGEDDCDQNRAAFSDLAPETIAVILKDCAHSAEILRAYGLTADDGRRFWEHRALGFPGPNALDAVLREEFPPLTAHLGDDGRVHLREAQADA